MLLKLFALLLISNFIFNIVNAKNVNNKRKHVKKLRQLISKDELNQDSNEIVDQVVDSNEVTNVVSSKEANDGPEDVSKGHFDANSQSKDISDDEVVNKSRYDILPYYCKTPDCKDKLTLINDKVLDRLESEENGFDLTPEEIEKFKIWKNGIIPYYIDVVSFNDKVIRDSIRSFLQSVNSLTSVKFLELPSPPSEEESRWVMFLNRRGLLECADHSVMNFTNQGVQKVVLGYHCMATGDELAEAVLSILSIPAQHNAPDRDTYINVKFENILPEKKYLFEKLRNEDWMFHDLPYDFFSATHYDYNKYSANGHVTIEPKDPEIILYPRISLSTFDIKKIQMLYNYITRNRKLQASDCKKLFKPGKWFSSHKTKKVEMKPRKKPNKYTGEVDANESINETETPENSETLADDANNKDSKHETGREENMNDKVQNYGDVNKGRVKLQIKSRDPLSLLSDYQTDEDRPQKKKG